MGPFMVKALKDVLGTILGAVKKAGGDYYISMMNLSFLQRFVFSRA